MILKCSTVTVCNQFHRMNTRIAIYRAERWDVDNVVIKDAVSAMVKTSVNNVQSITGIGCVASTIAQTVAG